MDGYYSAKPVWAKHERGESVVDAAGSMARARPRCAPAGVTLIELLAVVVLLGVLAAVALPRLANSGIWMAEGEAGARKLAATLRLARRMAVENAPDNPGGYTVECTTVTYGIVDPDAVGFGEVIALPKGWRFDQDGYQVTFDPHGGAQPAVGGPNQLVIRRGDERWIVHFEPATGYVWCEQAEES